MLASPSSSFPGSRCSLMSLLAHTPTIGQHHVILEVRQSSVGEWGCHGDAGECACEMLVVPAPLLLACAFSNISLHAKSKRALCAYLRWDAAYVRSRACLCVRASLLSCVQVYTCMRAWRQTPLCLLGFHLSSLSFEVNRQFWSTVEPYCDEASLEGALRILRMP